MSSKFSRRNFIGLSLAGLGLALFSGKALGADSHAAQSAPKKPLVVYFSHSGNTRKVAEMIHNKVGGDIIEIRPVESYPDEYNKLTELAKKEQQAGARPAVQPESVDLAQYDVIFLGYPNWWSSMPMPVYTFIEKNKLDGKTVAPFATHGGGGLGHSVEDLKKLAPHSRILKPFSVSGTAAGRAEKDVLRWLEGLGQALIETTTGNTKIYPDGGY